MEEERENFELMLDQAAVVIAVIALSRQAAIALKPRLTRNPVDR